MFYCKNCLLLTQENRCPRCLKKKLRVPQINDFCFLLNLTISETQHLEQIFEYENIKFAKMPVREHVTRASICMSPHSYNIFVCYQDYEKAKEICKEILNRFE